MFEIITVCVIAFVAGFIDSMVGGGGLVQTPGLLFTFPNVPIPTLLGTAKIPSLLGTSVSAWQYAKRVPLFITFLVATGAFALVFAFLGASSVTLLPKQALKPLVLVLLLLVFVYTIFKKDFGQSTAQVTTPPKWWLGCIIGALMGFYDGFFGPGTGTFLIMAFISILKMDFLHASAHAKLVNCATNIAALIFFMISGNVLYHIALPMAICNIVGSAIGSSLALRKGNKFLRIVFLCVMVATISRYAWDVFK